MNLRLATLPLLLLIACRQPQLSPPAPSSTTTAAAAPEAGPPKVMREERCRDAARACGAAFVSRDYERLFDCMPSRVFDTFPDGGGRAGLRAQILRDLDEMAKDGVYIEGADYDVPQDVAAGGTRLFAIVPEVLTMKVPDGHLLQHSFMVGVSDDGGESWKFVSGSVAKEDLLRVFPEFPSSLELPVVPKPVLVP